MSYPFEIKNKAQDILKQQRDKNALLLSSRRDEVFEKCPDIKRILLDLQSTKVKLLKAVMSGKDAKAQIDEIHKENQKQKNSLIKLLIKNGYKADYLDMIYSCPICKDSGVNEVGKKCNCVKEIEKKLMLEKLGSECDYMSMTFENFSLEKYRQDFKEYNEKKLDFLKNYVNNFNEHSESILFVGPPGVGKTHLSVSIATKIIEKGYDVFYMPFHKLLGKYENAKFNRTNETIEEILNDALKCDLLILDDLGAEFISSLSSALLYDVVNTRMTERKPTIISSNLLRDEITKKYEERMTSRLFGTFNVISILGEDLRRNNR